MSTQKEQSKGRTLKIMQIRSQNAICLYIHTYHLRSTPERVAEASQIHFRDAHVLPN
jgi:hypothetical protein